MEHVSTEIPLLGAWGITHPLTYINVSLILHTWIALLVMGATVLLARYFHRRKGSMGNYVVTTIVKYFMDLCTQSLGKFNYGHFSFIFALFLFILFCNLMGNLPFVHEPTANLNTTLALGITAFIYTTFYEIKTHGLKEYLKEYLQPFFLMLPLNIIGKFASIISISFRLFGNMFGGSLISGIYMNGVGSSYILGAVGLLSGINFCIALFFGIFEGLIQAFVFAMLSLTYLSIGTRTDSTETI